jgi:predicted NBD/HSP70 family sugar kinase
VTDKGNSNQHTRSQVLRLIKDCGQISRAELALRIGLTRPTVSVIVTELSELGLLRETGKGESRGGKRPIMLELKVDACYAIGIDLGDDLQIRGVLCDLHGKTIRFEELDYENRFDSILSVLIKLTAKLATGIQPKKIKGIGIAVSGIVNTATNEVIKSKTFDIKHRDLAQKLESASGFKVILENRPNAAALAEVEFGAGKNYRSMVYITSGRGVGAGIVIDGKIFRGGFGTAGEIGELLIPVPTENGGFKQCFLEEITRSKAICAEVEKVKGRKMSYAKILEGYRRNDPDIGKIIEQNAAYMAQAALVVANLLDPEAIVLGGRAVELGEAYFATFKRCFDRGMAASSGSGKTQARYSECGLRSVAVGGATVVLNQVLNLKI